MTLVGVDIEDLLIRLINGGFGGNYTVSNVVPPGPISTRLITVVSNGGPQLNPSVDQAHVNVILYHPDPEAVMDEALRLQAFLNDLRTPNIRKVSASLPSRTGSGNPADEESPRRFMYADIRLRKDIH